MSRRTLPPEARWRRAARYVAGTLLLVLAAVVMPFAVLLLLCADPGFRRRWMP